MNNSLNNTGCVDCKFACVNLLSSNNFELEELFNSKRTINYKKSETIFKQSTFVSHIAFIRSGIVKIFTEGYNNKNIILRFITKNNFIGLPFIFNNNYSFYTATAINDVELCLIEKSEFANFMIKDDTLKKNILNIISNNTSLLYDKISSLGTKQLHGRLASAIINLSKGDFREENIFSYITKKELAEYTGMSLESLMRLLNELKSDKIIEQKGKEIVINDYNMLDKLSVLG